VLRPDAHDKFADSHRVGATIGVLGSEALVPMVVARQDDIDAAAL
jgi:hypothetical protein